MLEKMYNDKCDTFHAKYKVLDKIGEGSFSEVLKCIHRSTGAFYAAKRLKKYYKSETSILTCAEVVAAQKVPFHPNILNLLEYHYDSFSGQVTYIFELMDMSLYDHLKARTKSESKLRGLSEQKAKDYLYQLLRGLEHLHRNGLFHRDVKPENILIKFPSVDTMRLHKLKKYEIIKLADLGSVRGIYSIPPYTEYISTRWYRSPECLLSNGNYGPKMDVWATGCVFYEMMTLLPLFPGSNEIDQLYKIHHILGSPTMQFLNKLKSRSRNCVVFPKTRGTGIDSMLSQTTRQAKAILELMIEYDPDKRVNVRRLLKSPYFDDIRYKFEPHMEGQNCQNVRNSSYRIHEYGKRSIGDITAAKPKIMKREHWSEESKRRSHHGSASSESKTSTPSIEIPYYTPHQTNSSKGKHTTSLPLVDYKISRYMDNSRVNSSDSNTSGGLSRKNSIKRSVEIILRSSRNSDSGKHSSSKEKGDPSRFYSRSVVIKKNVNHASDVGSQNLKTKSRNSTKQNKPSV